MRIENTNTSLTYTSRKCPIKPFKIQTGNGILTFKEINYDNEYGNKFFRTIGEFFLDIFANTSSHPFWAKCRKPTLDQKVYDKYVSEDILRYRKAVKDVNTTILIGRNKWGKIKAAIFTRPLNIENKVKDSKTLYIDALAVDKKYRGQNIGQKLVNKVIKTSKKRFEDVFLVAYKESVPFYEKLGFKITQATKKDSKSVANLAKERIDYPDYAQFMELKLFDKSGKKWYERADENIY